MKWNLTGYYNGHQHAKNIKRLFGVVWVLGRLKDGESIRIRKVGKYE